MDILTTPVGLIYIARTLIDKTRGVIGREDLLDSGVVIIPECNWVHGFFLRKPIYVYFLDNRFRFLRQPYHLVPYAFSPLLMNAKHVVETRHLLSDSQIRGILDTLASRL